jgi:hypothetical protein
MRASGSIKTFVLDVLVLHLTTHVYSHRNFRNNSHSTMPALIWEGPISRLWINPVKAEMAPLTIEDHEFARELLKAYNQPTTMSRKRSLDDSHDAAEPEIEPAPTSTTMTVFEQVTDALSGLASSIFNLFTTKPPEPTPEPISAYAVRLGTKRRLVEVVDPSRIIPPTPVAQKYSVPGAWPATSELPQVLTLENAQAAWAAASLDERKRIVYGDSNVPYWRKNNLPPHFPHNDLDQMLEHKYVRSADLEEWDRENFNRYKPLVSGINGYWRPEGREKLPSITNKVYLKPPTEEEKRQAWPSLFEPRTTTYERVPDVNLYRPFTNIRKYAASTSSSRPTTVEEITNKIKHYKSIREHRDFDCAHPGVLRYLQQLSIGIHHPKPRAYAAIQKTSLYKYRHGKNRPATSVLKTSNPSHRPFEPSLEGPEPKNEHRSASSPAAKTAPDGDEIMDISMMDMDALPTRGVHWPAPSQITGNMHQPTKVFYNHEPINNLPNKLRQYREHTPIEDDSLLVDDTPKRYFGHEQDNEPKYNIDDPDLDDIAKDWADQTRLEAENFRRELISWSSPHANPDNTPSKAFQARVVRNHERYMAIRQEKYHELLGEIAARHEQERKIREQEAAKKAEEERLIKEALVQREKERQEARRKEAKAYHDSISLIKPLSDEWSAKVDTAMATEDKAAIIIPKQNISRHDLGTILPQKGIDSSLSWLNDQIVNGSLQQMVDHALTLEGHDKKSTTKPAKYWAVNSNWLNTVLKSKHGDGITRWAGKRGVNLKGKNLLEAEAIFMPVCSGNHWTLVVVRPKKRIIEYLDSLSNKREDPSKIRVALRWISYELGKEYDEDEWRAVFNRSPQQNNGVDCGAFVIMNAMAAIRAYDPQEYIHPNQMYEARRMIVAQLMNGGYTGEFEWMEKTLEMPNSYKEMLAEQGKA